MGMGFAFASGFFEGMVDAKRRKDEIALKKIETDAESQKFIAEQLFNIDPNNLGPGAKAWLEYYTGVENLFDLSNAMDQADKPGYTIYGEQGQSLFIPFSQEYDASKPNFYMAQLDDIDRYAQTNGDVLSAFLKNNPSAMTQFTNDMGQLENFANLQNTKNQRVPGVEGVSIFPYNFSENHPYLTELSENLNVQPNPEQTNEAIVTSTNIEYNPETEAVIFLPFQGLESEGLETIEPVVISTEMKNGLINIASRTGYKNVEEYLANFMYFDANLERGKNESKNAFIIRQNKHLELAVLFENRGYGSIMRGEKAASDEELKLMLGDIELVTGKNKSVMTMSLAALLPLKNSFFTKNNTDRVFSSTKGKLYTPKVTIKEYAMEIYGITNEQDFMTGVEAAERSINNLDRLIAIETDELDYTGFVRYLFGTMEGIGDQVSQIGKGINSYFGTQADIGNGLDTENGTSEESLMQVVERVNKDLDLGINLEAMTEADVLRLTLAADMARAVDPSGRLSNQDFEIQLRRLGATKLGTKAQIRIALNTVRNQFVKDIETKRQIGTILKANMPLTATTARRIQADALLADFARRTYEPPKASGQEDVSSPDVVSFPIDNLKPITVPAYQEIPSFEGVYLPKATGPYTPGWYVQDQETGAYRLVNNEERQAIISMSQ